MSDVILLDAEVRSKLGSGAARELRRNGKVPAVIFGQGTDPIAVSLPEKEITKY